MVRRFLFPFLALLGFAAMTFPFLWLELNPNFQKSTMGIRFAPEHGLQFFSDLSPILLIGFLLWINHVVGFSALIFRVVDTISAPVTARWPYHWPAITLLAVAASFPFYLSNSWLVILTFTGIYMVLAVGLNITVGLTGLLVLGYAGFYAFGAYFLALMHGYYPWFAWWMALPLAFILGGILGYMLGLPCLRLRGDYLAIVTLGFAEAFRETLRNLDFTGGSNGLDVLGLAAFPKPALFGYHTQQWPAYFAVLVTLTLCVIFVQRLYYSPIGKAWIAIRENEIAAASMGIPVVKMKLLAFSLSAGVAAVAGVLYAAKEGFVDPKTCDFQNSIMILAMVILGGLGNTYGAVLGAALIYLVPEYLKQLPIIFPAALSQNSGLPDFLIKGLQHVSDYRLLIFGATMVLMMLYRPQGLMGSHRRHVELTEGTS